KIVLPDPSTTYFQSSIATVLILNKILLMKTSIYILLTFLLQFTASVSVFSQEHYNYYTGKDKLEINGEVYKVTVDELSFTLENINNTLSYQKQFFPDGEQVPIENGLRASLINYEVIGESLLACFSEHDIIALKAERAAIIFTNVISLNGEILETYIVVHSRGKYIYSLPPEKIIAFAETIKENAKFKVDPFVKKVGLTFVKKVTTIAFREHLK
ncbi:MAG: hypothetical protein PHR97_06160, partial [Bacteroidales bacterium]|nr:hypothetical protein [Bacteroidales bacterium]